MFNLIWVLKSGYEVRCEMQFTSRARAVMYAENNMDKFSKSMKGYFVEECSQNNRSIN